jgi:hypothetical protein
MKRVGVSEMYGRKHLCSKTSNVDLQVFYLKFIDMLLDNAIPFLKADGIRNFIEETGPGLRLPDRSHLAKMIPSLIQRDITKIIQPLEGRKSIGNI